MYLQTVSNGSMDQKFLMHEAAKMRSAGHWNSGGTREKNLPPAVSLGRYNIATQCRGCLRQNQYESVLSTSLGLFAVTFMPWLRLRDADRGHLLTP
jgi:hypothetical protein